MSVIGRIVFVWFCLVHKPKTTEFAPYGNDLQETLPAKDRLQVVKHNTLHI